MKCCRVVSCTVVTLAGQALKKRDPNAVGIEAVYVSRSGIDPGGQGDRFRQEVDPEAGQVITNRIEVMDVEGKVNRSGIGCLNVKGFALWFDYFDQFEHRFAGSDRTKERHADMRSFVPEDKAEVRTVTFLLPEKFESEEFFVKVEAVLEVPYGDTDMVPTTNRGGELRIASLHFAGILTRKPLTRCGYMARWVSGFAGGLAHGASENGRGTS